uniref:Cyclic nucleotide-binding domain-containing protein n=1 Tax=Haptolina ericina TaxID=156174 RepID=A0A7S3F5A9_9EUKA
MEAAEEAQPLLLEIGELTDPQYFGELAFVGKGEHTATVVSSSAVEVLMLSKYDQSKFFDKKVLDLINSYAQKFYLDEASIRKSILRKHKWESYKAHLLQELTIKK